jgi:predicted AAA+ superfamily ATPase
MAKKARSKRTDARTKIRRHVLFHPEVIQVIDRLLEAHPRLEHTSRLVNVAVDVLAQLLDSSDGSGRCKVLTQDGTVMEVRFVFG